jgi:hypothetical protein
MKFPHLRFSASSLLKLTMPEGRLIVWNLGFGAWNFPRRGQMHLTPKKKSSKPLTIAAQKIILLGVSRVI